LLFQPCIHAIPTRTQQAHDYICHQSSGYGTTSTLYSNSTQNKGLINNNLLQHCALQQLAYDGTDGAVIPLSAAPVGRGADGVDAMA
jgi:hypothetical protein